MFDYFSPEHTSKEADFFFFGGGGGDNEKNALALRMVKDERGG